MAGDTLHDLLDAEHTLRPAEAAKGGVGRQVGAATMASDPGIAQVVGVVGMEHRPVDDGPGQIRREAAVGQ
ncbi:hypothetical protein D3C86_1650480 [compost metagenome]